MTLVEGLSGAVDSLVKTAPRRCITATVAAAGLYFISQVFREPCSKTFKIVVACGYLCYLFVEAVNSIDNSKGSKYRSLSTRRRDEEDQRPPMIPVSTAQRAAVGSSKTVQHLKRGEPADMSWAG